VDRDELIARCEAKPGATADHPWGPEGLVYKVGGKIFAFVGVAEEPPAVTCKCHRDRIDEWRSRYPDHIGPARYLTNKPWNRIHLDGVADDDAAELVDDSYAEVVQTLPRSRRPAGWDGPVVT
jgi:predicted DNA-binding protein (MmcQ/YjbR family)